MSFNFWPISLYELK